MPVLSSHNLFQGGRYALLIYTIGDAPMATDNSPIVHVRRGFWLGRRRSLEGNSGNPVTFGAGDWSIGGGERAIRCKRQVILS